MLSREIWHRTLLHEKLIAPHDSENVDDETIKAVNEFGIPNKIFSITFGNARMNAV